MKRRVGAILVRDNRILATGYTIPSSLLAPHPLYSRHGADTTAPPAASKTVMKAAVPSATTPPPHSNVYASMLRRTRFSKLGGRGWGGMRFFIRIRELPSLSLLGIASRRKELEADAIIRRCPCLKCTIIIIQAGVKEVVYELSYKVYVSSSPSRSLPKLTEELCVQRRRIRETICRSRREAAETHAYSFAYVFRPGGNIRQDR